MRITATLMITPSCGAFGKMYAVGTTIDLPSPGSQGSTAGFARTFGPRVRCNAIMAGTFLTDVSRSWDKDAFAARAQRFALRRGGQPSEIVGTAIYLASDASSYTTGAVLSVDGGQP